LCQIATADDNNDDLFLPAVRCVHIFPTIFWKQRVANFAQFSSAMKNNSILVLLIFLDFLGPPTEVFSGCFGFPEGFSPWLPANT